MRKTYVLDTNVLLHDPQSLLKFEDNTIIFPLTVIEEIDHAKEGKGELSYSARQILRLIDSLRNGGNISRGVRLPGGGFLKVAIDETNPSFGKASNDNRIISAALARRTALNLSKC